MHLLFELICTIDTTHTYECTQCVGGIQQKASTVSTNTVLVPAKAENTLTWPTVM